MPHPGPSSPTCRHFPYLKCPQRRLYSAWKIADIYLRRFAEHWNTLSASLRKLEIFSVLTSAIFPYAGPQLSAERSADINADIGGHLRTSLRTSMRMSAWMGADICGRPHGWVRMSAEVRMDRCGHPQGQRMLELLPLLCNNLLIICGITWSYAVWLSFQCLLYIIIHYAKTIAVHKIRMCS